MGAREGGRPTHAISWSQEHSRESVWALKSKVSRRHTQVNPGRRGFQARSAKTPRSPCWNTSQASKTVDPAFRNHRHVIMALDRGNLGGLHRVGHDASGAAPRSTEAGEDRGNWNLCNRCDSHLQLTLARLGWSARSTRFFAIDDRTFVDLSGVAPKTVARWVDQATVSWTGSLELRMSEQALAGTAGWCLAEWQTWSNWHTLVGQVGLGRDSDLEAGRFLSWGRRQNMPAVAKDGGNFVPQLQRVIVRFRLTGRHGRHTSCASPQQTFQTSHMVHRLLRVCWRLVLVDLLLCQTSGDATTRRQWLEHY